MGQPTLPSSRRSQGGRSVKRALRTVGVVVLAIVGAVLIAVIVAFIVAIAPSLVGAAPYPAVEVVAVRYGGAR